MTVEKEEKRQSLLAEDLASLEDYIHDLFNFSPLPICFVSPVGVILEINPAFEKISEFGFYEIVGEPIEKLFKREEIEELAKETLDKGFVEGRELVFSPKGEKEITAQVFTRTRRDEKGKAVGYFLGLFDLTGIKKTEVELKESQTALLNILEDTEDARGRAEEEKNKTEAIITSLSDGLLVFDKENRLILINPQAGKFFNIELEKTVGQSVSDLAEHAELKTLMDFLGSEIKKLFREELEIRENFILEVSTISLTTKEEKMGNLVILHNVSREKMIERMKTEFVSISAHQLRTPLSAIKWTLKMLLEGDLGEITSEQRNFIEKTYQSNERMIALINDLLNVTRIEEGRYLYKPTLSSIESIVESVINSYREEIEKRNIKLELKKPKKKIPKVMVDVEKIELAFQNLLDNAVRYTPPGGEVIVSLTQDKEETIVSIKDTGVGIPEDQQKRVFSKFFRGANVIRMETEGSGLGLFISKNIIEAHGGQVWFKSKERKGTTFYFSLPIKKEFEEFLEKL
jgi:PAS domain S-box-containing protein